jgi:hypothetical protein
LASITLLLGIIVEWPVVVNKKFSVVHFDSRQISFGESNLQCTGTTAIVEVTPEGEVVWLLKLKDIVFTREESAARGFYKAERICLGD